MSANERVAARASLGIGLMIGDVFVTAHAGRAVSSNLSLMNVVTGDAVSVGLGLVGDTMKTR